MFLKYSVASIGFLVTALVLNLFKNTWLEITPGYSPHIIGYSILYLLPLLLLALIFGLIAIIQVLFLCKKRTKIHYLALFLSLPGVVLGTIAAIALLPLILSPH